MKVVHIVNADLRGGAPKAAFAINKALQSIGVDSKMLVQRKFSIDESVTSINHTFISKQKTNFRMLLDLLQMRLFTKNEKGRFSFASIGTDISKHKLVREADIIHLHWINEGYLSLKSLSLLAGLNKSIVWTLHDMWAFTGGCHYSSSCNNYESSCGGCPYLKYSFENDASKKILKKKIELYKLMDLSFVTCSNWLKECAKRSSLLKNFPVYVIPNPIETSIYRPIEKSFARKQLNLPPNKKFILFGTLNVREERKGFKQLVEALQKLLQLYPSYESEVELLMYGTTTPEIINNLPLKVNSFGRIANENQLINCYNSADIFVAPSLEDNLPNTVMESLACGIPVVAFNIGGMPDMIDHLINGYLAVPFDNNDLANGIYWAIKNPLPEINNTARNKILEKFNLQRVAKKYLEIY
jgi:glycosyltransferase involved in cell wall biosynthesis